MLRAILAAVSLLSVGVAGAEPLTGVQQARRCDAQWRGITAKGQVGAKSRAAFMKACLADVNTVAALPGDVTMSAPAGATGLCKDGRYTASTTRQGACAGHGGLSRWIS